MIGLFELDFFRNAFWLSLLLGFLYGMISFVIVTRRMAFIGAGIAHTAFGGAALGIILGIDPFYTSILFCVTSAVLITQLTRTVDLSYDTSIGIFFAFSMALGALLIALRKTYTFNLSGYFFGNILGASQRDLLMALGIALLFSGFLILFFQKILFLSFDERVAEVSGVHTRLLDTLILIFLAFIIVISIRIVGIILVSALVVLPASYGLLFSKKYRAVIFIAIGYTIGVMVSGLFLSYYFDTPAGATIVVSGTVIYFITLFISQLLRK